MECGMFPYLSVLIPFMEWMEYSQAHLIRPKHMENFCDEFGRATNKEGYLTLVFNGVCSGHSDKLSKSDKWKVIFSGYQGFPGAVRTLQLTGSDCTHHIWVANSTAYNAYKFESKWFLLHNPPHKNSQELIA